MLLVSGGLWTTSAVVGAVQGGVLVEGLFGVSLTGLCASEGFSGGGFAGVAVSGSAWLRLFWVRSYRRVRAS